jgi:molybdate/tungstate transport system permease protein
MAVSASFRPLHLRPGRLIPDPFTALTFSTSLVIIAFIVLPLVEMVVQPSLNDLWQTLRDADVLRSIWLSIWTAVTAAILALLWGTPLAYLLARRNFRGKRLVESIIDLPIMIPHPIVGIAILGMAGRDHWMGKILTSLGVRIMGSATGIVAVMLFVGLPFYVNTVKAGFEAIPERTERVSRTLGASAAATFFRVTLPLAWRHMVVGVIMCTARAISEFGAIVIVAYHPMVAPVLIYERFTAFGLKYSQPVAVWLIFMCLGLFLLLRFFSIPSEIEEGRGR